MKKKIKLLKAWGSHAVGAVLELSETEAKSLIDTGFGEAVESGRVKVELLKSWAGQPVGTVLELDESDSKPLVEKGYGKVVAAEADPGQKAVADLLTGFRKGLEQIVADVAKNFVDAAAKNGGSSKGLKFTGSGTRADDEGNFGYKNLGEFMVEVKTACLPNGKAKMPERLAAVHEKTPTGMSENQGDDGGYLVPTELSTRVQERAFPEQALANRCDGLTLNSNSIEIPSLIDDTRTDGNRWGGVLGYWLEEATQITNSRPKFTNIKLKLHKLAVLIYVTDELLSDSTIALEQYVSRKAGDEINFQTSNAIVAGQGITRPLGVLNSPAKVQVARAQANAVGTADIFAMWNRMWVPSRQSAVWIINQEVEPQLLQLTYLIKNVAGSENVGGWPMYFPIGGMNNSPYSTLLGRPVLPLEYCSALGTEGDIMLVDFAQYCLATKGGVQSAMSIHLRFDYDETAFRFTYRCDGQTWWNKPVTPFKGSAGKKYSPFVSLV